MVLLAGLLLGTFVRGAGALWHELKTFQVDGKPALFILAPPLITVFGVIALAVFGWYQFRMAHKQREKQFHGAQHQAQRLADQKERQERLHFARKELQDQFTDIQNRLEKETSLVRANAALRLADFATRLDPAKEPTDDVSPRPPRNEKNNPYFVQVASLLANALYLEPDEAVRHSISKALDSLTTFARESENAALLYVLVEKLADVNRAAKAQFVQVLAAWAVSIQGKSKDILGEEDIALAATVTCFCTNQEDTIICLKSLIEEGQKKDFKGVVVQPSRYAVLHIVATERHKDLPPAENTQSLVLLERTGKQLGATCNALALTLTALPELCPSLNESQTTVETLVANLQSKEQEVIVEDCLTIYLKMLEPLLQARRNQRSAQANLTFAR